MIAALVLVLLLTALEYLHWLSPLAPRFQRWENKLGNWYYLFPFHYITRLVLLGIVMYAFRPNMAWPLFAGGAAWGWSLLGGLVLLVIGMPVVLLRPMNLTVGAFFQKAGDWRRATGWRFWVQTGYITAFPGFVEELLFRWVVPAALWPVIGWWVLVVGPFAMAVWHIPVWWVHFAGQRAAFRITLMQTTIYSILLTLIAVSTGNIAGCVFAHAFGDWAGSAMRYKAKQAA